MDARTKLERLDTFEARCREQGLPLTPQRRIIFEEFLNLDNHPSADQVYERVAVRLPGVSRTTLYRSFEILVKMGLITRTSHPGRSVRYDRRTELHHHLVCLYCDTVMDIDDPELDSLRLPDTSPHDFEVTDYQLQIRGICRSCREKEENE